MSEADGLESMLAADGHVPGETKALLIDLEPFYPWGLTRWWRLYSSVHSYIALIARTCQVLRPPTNRCVLHMAKEVFPRAEGVCSNPSNDKERRYGVLIGNVPQRDNLQPD